MIYSSNPILGAVLIFSVTTYLGAFFYLITYLRRVYTTTWVERGGFAPWDARRRQLNGDLIGWYVAGMRTVGFALFSNQYNAVRDRKLTGLIWLVGASCALGIVLMLVIMVPTSFNGTHDGFASRGTIGLGTLVFAHRSSS
ncbi:MAG: hypothetical protein WA776_05470 [Xanthobacteraceae bacterium]